MKREQFKRLMDAYWSINEGNNPVENEPTAVLYLGGHVGALTVTCYYEGFDADDIENGESYYVRLCDKSDDDSVEKAISQLEYTSLLQKRFAQKKETYISQTMNEVEKRYAETIAEIEARYDRRLKEVEERLKCVGL